MVKLAVSKAVVWATTPRSHLTRWCLHGNGPRGDMAADQAQTRLWGLVNREGDSGLAEPPQEMASACLCSTGKARGSRAFQTLVYRRWYLPG